MSKYYYVNNETISKESIDKYEKYFHEYINNNPTLQDALMQMFSSSGVNLQKSKILIKEILSTITEHLDSNYSEIKKTYPNLTMEEAQIISSYTCELQNTEDKQYNPYKILNINLVSKDRNKGILKISKYLFIFLKALRKLNRFYPDNKILYRCINSHVELNYDQFDKNKIPYMIGNTKMFWSFTSTSQNPKTSMSFLGKIDNYKSGTIFTIKNAWGYNIKLFNAYNEEEILVEPERKIKIKDVLPKVNNIIYVTCKVIDTPLVLEKIFEMEKSQAIKPIKNISYKFDYKTIPKSIDIKSENIKISKISKSNIYFSDNNKISNNSINCNELNDDKIGNLNIDQLINCKNKVDNTQKKKISINIINNNSNKNDFNVLKKNSNNKIIGNSSIKTPTNHTTKYTIDSKNIYKNIKVEKEKDYLIPKKNKILSINTTKKIGIKQCYSQNNFLDNNNLCQNRIINKNVENNEKIINKLTNNKINLAKLLNTKKINNPPKIIESIDINKKSDFNTYKKSSIKVKTEENINSKDNSKDFYNTQNYFYEIKNKYNTIGTNKDNNDYENLNIDKIIDYKNNNYKSNLKAPIIDNNKYITYNYLNTKKNYNILENKNDSINKNNNLYNTSKKGGLIHYNSEANLFENKYNNYKFNYNILDENKNNNLENEKKYNNININQINNNNEIIKSELYTPKINKTPISFIDSLTAKKQQGYSTNFSINEKKSGNNYLYNNSNNNNLYNNNLYTNNLYNNNIQNNYSYNNNTGNNNLANNYTAKNNLYNNNDKTNKIYNYNTKNIGLKYYNTETNLQQNNNDNIFKKYNTIDNTSEDEEKYNYLNMNKISSYNYPQQLNTPKNYNSQKFLSDFNYKK